MLLSESLFAGLLLHLCGDYLLQNHYLSQQKTQAHIPALIHAGIHGLLFLTIISPALAFVVFVTHFFIDRYRLAVYWIKLVNWNFQSTNFGFPEDVPKFLSIWLMIIIDNIFHISINSLCVWAQFNL